MATIVYLTLEQILVIHQDQIERYGGKSGLRNLSLLESALFRPQTMFAGHDLYGSHFEKAAALLHSIIMNHAFVDGNKRTGATAMLIFLALNDIHLQIKDKTLVTTVMQIESEKWKIERITKWLESSK